MKNRLLNICILCMVFPFFLQAADTHSVYNLRCEQEENPLGIETGQPCFSWQTQGRGNYSMFFDRYEPVPKNVQDKVLANHAK